MRHARAYFLEFHSLIKIKIIAKAMAIAKNHIGTPLIFNVIDSTSSIEFNMLESSFQIEFDESILGNFIKRIA